MTYLYQNYSIKNIMGELNASLISYKQKPISSNQSNYYYEAQNLLQCALHVEKFHPRTSRYHLCSTC